MFDYSGTIHLKNMLGNHRLELLYIMEASAERRKTIQFGHGITGVQFIGPEELRRSWMTPG